jgi:hypothetical protein
MPMFTTKRSSKMLTAELNQITTYPRQAMHVRFNAIDQDKFFAAFQSREQALCNELYSKYFGDKVLTEGPKSKEFARLKEELEKAVSKRELATIRLAQLELDRRQVYITLKDDHAARDRRVEEIGQEMEAADAELQRLRDTISDLRGRSSRVPDEIMAERSQMLDSEARAVRAEVESRLAAAYQKLADVAGPQIIEVRALMCVLDTLFRRLDAACDAA